MGRTNCCLIWCFFYNNTAAVDEADLHRAVAPGIRLQIEAMARGLSFWALSGRVGSTAEMGSIM